MLSNRRKSTMHQPQLFLALILLTTVLLSACTGLSTASPVTIPATTSATPAIALRLPAPTAAIYQPSVVVLWNELMLAAVRNGGRTVETDLFAGVD
jgi:hypothetical protein